MEVCDRDLSEARTGDAWAGAGADDDLAEADRLIEDLAALVESGLIVVHQHVLGPARYAASFTAA